MRDRLQNFAFFLVFIFFFACNSSPSVPEVAEPDGIDPSFEPASMSWQTAEIPQTLIGSWYKDGSLHLLVSEDTLRVAGGFLAELEEIASSGEYYRIIYKIGSDYHAAYILKLTGEEVQIAYTDSSASDLSGAAWLPLLSVLNKLTATNPWLNTCIPSNINGKWLDWTGQRAIIISDETVLINRDSWQISAVQTNCRYNRLVLQKASEYKTIYFITIKENTMRVIIADSMEDIQDRYCGLEGERKDLYRFAEILDILPLSTGSHWSYSYTYREDYYYMYPGESSQDSVVHQRYIHGVMDLEVTGNTITADRLSGEITLLTSFQIDSDSSRTINYRRSGEELEIVYDSAQSATGIFESEQHEIFLESDTLWYRTPEGKSFFTNTKYVVETDVDVHNEINPRFAVYPFDFPRKGFPNGKDVSGFLFITPLVSPECSPGHSSEITHSGSRTYLFPQEGFRCVGCYNVDRNDSYETEQGGPYFEDTYFLCELIN